MLNFLGQVICSISDKIRGEEKYIILRSKGAPAPLKAGK